MLSKNNKILIGCLALLLVMSVGYALFSDTITVNGTATAKGEFDMTATCQPGISSKLGTVESLGLSNEGGYENDSCSVVDDVVSANVNLKYPGARKYFTVKITNTGTISATTDLDEKIKNGEYCYSTTLESEPNICFDFKGAGSATIFHNEQHTQYSKGVGAEYLYAISDANDNVLPNEELINYYNMETNAITLPPGYSGYLVLEYSVESNNSSGVLNAKINSTLEIPFTQAQ